MSNRHYIHQLFNSERKFRVTCIPISSVKGVWLCVPGRPATVYHIDSASGETTIIAGQE